MRLNSRPTAFVVLFSLLTSIHLGYPASETSKSQAVNKSRQELATFAGGCFWCMQQPFDKLKGVIRTTAGYTGGTEKNPTYEQNSTGLTGHAESVEIVFDPSQITYTRLLDVYWHNIDPTTRDREFVDAGHEYRTAIFYHNGEQKQLALESKKKWEKAGIFGAPIVTEIVPATAFWPAEEYHQKYYQKNPLRYRFYRNGSGRDQYLKKLWGDQYKH